MYQQFQFFLSPENILCCVSAVLWLLLTLRTQLPLCSHKRQLLWSWRRSHPLSLPFCYKEFQFWVTHVSQLPYYLSCKFAGWLFHLMLGILIWLRNWYFLCYSRLGTLGVDGVWNLWWGFNSVMTSYNKWSLYVIWSLEISFYPFLWCL